MNTELKNQLKAEQRVVKTKSIRIKELNALKQVIYAMLLLIVSIIPIVIDGDGTLMIFAVFVLFATISGYFKRKKIAKRYRYYNANNYS